LPTSNRSPAFAITLLLLSVAIANADVTFIFTGAIPRGSSHPLIENGETWEARFQIDESMAAETPTDPRLGQYLGSVVSGSIEFSGGYVGNFDVSGLAIYVSNDLAIGYGATPMDGVVIRPVGESPPFIGALTYDLSALDSNALPLPGTTFEGNIDVLGVAFDYEDEFGHVDYVWPQAGVHSFSVSTFPEPASPLLGDANLDETVDFFDVAPFISILSNDGFLAEADCNQDGVMSLLDIAPFISILSQ